MITKNKYGIFYQYRKGSLFIDAGISISGISILPFINIDWVHRFICVGWLIFDFQIRYARFYKK